MLVLALCLVLYVTTVSSEKNIPLCFLLLLLVKLTNLLCLHCVFVCVFCLISGRMKIYRNRNHKPVKYSCHQNLQDTINIHDSTCRVITCRFALTLLSIWSAAPALHSASTCCTSLHICVYRSAAQVEIVIPGFEQSASLCQVLWTVAHTCSTPSSSPSIMYRYRYQMILSAW